MNGYVIGAIVGALLVAPLFVPHDDTDPPREGLWRSRSGLGLYTDHKTGCQYVKAGLFGGTTPRLDADGLPLCPHRQTAKGTK